MKPDVGSGDSGKTDIPGGRRVQKDSPTVEALGAIDEASAAVGLARAFVKSPARKAVLHECQTVLLACGAQVASAGAPGAAGFDFASALARLEKHRKDLSALAPRPAHFLTPGDTPAEAALNLARTAVRRAERSLVALRRTVPAVAPEVAPYLNRLSDLLFDMLRAEIAGK